MTLLLLTDMTMGTESADMIRGTMDMLILKVLSLEPMHGWGITERIHQISEEPGVVVRGPPPSHPAGLDRLRLEDDTEPTEGTLLLADPRRRETAGSRA
jgi:hypothetical protein